MTDIVVPFTEPMFFDGGGFVGTGAWIGAAPYVDTFDTATSYGAVARPEAGRYGCGASYTFVGAPTALTLVCQVRPHFRTNTGLFTRVRLWMVDPVGGYSLVDSPQVVPDDTWQTVSIDLVTESGVIMADLMAVLANVAYLGASCYDGAAVDVSAVQLIATGVPINQQLQRRDGLGRGGVPLARGNATRQSSNQARVTY